MESKNSREQKEKRRKKYCDDLIGYESVYVQNAYNSGVLDLYKLFVWFIVNREVILERKQKKIIPKATREAIKNAKRGEKRLTRELGHSPVVVNVYKIDKNKRDVFIGKSENINLKSDLSPELSDRMIYEYAKINCIMDLFDKKELVYIYCMAYVSEEDFIDNLLSSENIVEAIKNHINMNKYETYKKLAQFNTEKILNIGKSSLYNYLKELKCKKTIEAKKELEIYNKLNGNIYVNINAKKCMIFVIREVERQKDINIVRYAYGGIKDRTSNLRLGKLECNNIEKDLYKYLLDKARIDNKIIVIDYSSLKGEKKLKKSIDYLAMFKYNVYLKT